MRWYLVNYTISSTSLSSCSLQAILLFLVGFENLSIFQPLDVQGGGEGESECHPPKGFSEFFPKG